jgi:hypothetical protein
MNTYFIQVELRNPSIGKPMLTTNGGFAMEDSRQTQMDV